MSKTKIRETLTIKWTVSRGRETYGYNICSLYVEGRKAASCNGGGYDMEGTVLADYIENKYQNELKRLGNIKDFYGVKVSEDGMKVYLDGGCGWDSIKRIVTALGLELNKLNYRSKGHTKVYLLERERGNKMWTDASINIVVFCLGSITVSLFIIACKS